MGPYQNCYPNNQMPMYSQGYNPMMNAQQRLAQMEQQYPQFAQQNQFQIQQPQTVGIAGRVVNDFSEITANEVPMDKIGAVFIKSDMSEICKKMWDAKTGMLETKLYKICFEQNESQGTSVENLKLGLSDDVTEVFMKRFDDLEKRLNEFGLTLTKSSTKNQTSRTKKEADSE